MSIRYFPKDMLRKSLPDAKVKRLVTGSLSLNRAAAASLAENSILSKKQIQDVSIRVIRGYKEKFKTETKADSIKGKKLLVARVQDTAVLEVAKEIKSQYRGDFYIWLPSDAETPDPEHQLKYGKKFRFGVGEMPGERWGCRCGMQILTPDEELELEADLDI